jgi:hypothetical protein
MTTTSGAAMPSSTHMLRCPAKRVVDLAAWTHANGCKGSDKGSDEPETWVVRLDLSTYRTPAKRWYRIPDACWLVACGPQRSRWTSWRALGWMD